MSYEEETTDLRAQVREFALEAAKERSLAEQATRARNTAQAKVRELEAELEHSRRAAMSELAQIQNEFFREKARAEKAQAALVDERKRTATGDCVKCGGDYANIEDHISLAHMLRENAEARVAELTSWIQAYADWSSGRRGATWPGEPIRLLAREREEG